MTPAQKTNAALTDVCRLLLEDYELTSQQIANLAKDIPGECEAMRKVWVEQIDAEADRIFAALASIKGGDVPARVTIEEISQ